ncbi:MAG: tetratricopeptide repeat protein [Aquificaceae bacterium]|nr:tetratricopeptide repeat protein [Aquificaceae bacterium]MDW8097423.1 tetratricopeptide repeat protein [Aquificaceae bacterium]
MDRLEYFKSLLEKTPDNPMVHYSLALEYYRLRDYEKTILHMSKYLSMKEDEGAGYRVLAKCYEETGQYDKAIQTLEEGIQKALRHNHPSMAEEFRTWAEQLRRLQSF